MDFDSSSKFISSLAKFLQSLCNGYVEFNSGVEVIGHIYLNVDTGKKIDYILNEKVCKTDENSVTFISNSFHAQPAERPKPAQKGLSDSLAVTSVTPDTRAEDEEIVIMEEPESKNVGTLPSRERFHRKNISPYSKVGRPPKRPHSQSFSSVNKHLPKQYKSDPPSGANGAQHDVETSHTDNPSNMVSSQLSLETSLTAATDSDISHLSKVFPQTFNETSNNQSTPEERDIKPQLDSDMNIVQVKQEITHSEHGGEEDQEIYDESQDQSVFPSMPYDQYYTDGSRRGQRSEYGPGGLPHEFFQGNAGPSGEGVGDTSDRLWWPMMGCPVPQCPASTSRFKAKAYFLRHWTEKHEPEAVHYKCQFCTLTTKRKCYTAKHTLMSHGVRIDTSDTITLVKSNKEYIDPSPITLNMCLGFN